MGRVEAIKKFFQRDDEFAPGGGRPVTMGELKALNDADKSMLAPACASALGVTLDAPQPGL